MSAERNTQLEDAARALVDLVKQHRTPGDEDLAVALADVERALPAFPAT